MSARDDVLARIHSALGDPHPVGDIPRAYRRHGDHAAGHPVLIDLLDERLADYGAHSHCAASDHAAGAVAEALAEGLAVSPQAPSGERPRIVVPPGLPSAWLAATDVDVVSDDGLDSHALDGCDGVVTAAAVAIADTGTIVLDGGRDQGRRAITLVPDLHVCVVRADQIVATVPEAIARLSPTRPLTWISGPSATSDIELDRVEGVHGPRTLRVVVLTQRDS